jgi:transglutaminase-like putative cysteine protease/type IV secretory pathway TrbD component/uncharacterized membrane protein
MRLLNAFPVLVLLTVVVAILSYSVASGHVLIAAVAIPAAALAWWMTETPAGSPLPRWLVNMLVLAAVAQVTLAVSRNETVTVEDMSRFVIFIQVIKLFDRKASRDYAQLLVLSLFLVLGAIMTSNSLELAAMLLVFLPFVLASVVLFQLYAGRERVAGDEGKGGGGGEPVGMEPVRVYPAVGMRVRRHLLATVTFATLGTLAISVAVFVLAPRGVGADVLGQWGRASVGSVTGFTDRVRLGGKGLISSSDTVVLDLEVTDAEGRPMGGPETTYYLRGAVLEEYTNGLWTRRMGKDPGYERVPTDTWWPLYGSRLRDSDATAVIQTITLRHANKSAYLFTVWRPEAVRFDERTRLRTFGTDTHGERVLLREGKPGRVRYTVRSHADSPPRPGATRAEYEGEDFGSPVVERVARELLVRSGIDPADAPLPPREAAAVLQRSLRETFEYTLSPDQPPMGADPTAWFLTDAKRGHCEYFASALAGMCRSVGINARVVTGYVAAEYNMATKHYVVRESNAHAWVEVETTPGRWMIFDGTPSSDFRRIHRPKLGLWGRTRAMFDAIEYAWINSVVSFDEKRRADLLDTGAMNTDQLTERLLRMFRQVQIGGVGLVVRALAIAAGVFAGTVILAMGLAGAWRRLGIWLSARRRFRAEAARDPEFVDRLAQTVFYGEMLAILRRRGLPKPSWMPPLVHADAVGPELGRPVAELSRLYYASRFGRRLLTDEELQAAADALERLRQGGLES